MAFQIAFTYCLLTVSAVYAQTPCTTLKPVFPTLIDPSGASTTYLSTKTSTSALDCGGCSLVVRTFEAILPSNYTARSTSTVPVTTATAFNCLPNNATITDCTSSTPSLPIRTPTASPLPPTTPLITTLISELQTAILYAELIANDGFSAKLCSVINPSALDQIEGIPVNGSAVQTEVCGLAQIDASLPCLADAVERENQRAIQYLFTALFAIQVAGNYAGGPNLTTLCNQIETDIINPIFIAFTNTDVGSQVKDIVCDAAAAASKA